jgi:hypothetical protein
MSRLGRLNRALIATALVALAISLGVWLTRAPLTAAPAIPAVKSLPEPTAATPPPVTHTVTPTTIEVPVEVGIAASAPVLADPPPAVDPIEAKPGPLSIRLPRRRGPFRRQ